MVCSESDEESVTMSQFEFHLVPIFKKVQGTNSFKYNEGKAIDVCFKCLMKHHRTFNLVFG